MTGSLIAKQIGPDAYRTIFCQIEGHLESQGDMLVKHFDTPEKVDELSAMMAGDFDPGLKEHPSTSLRARR